MMQRTLVSEVICREIGYTTGYASCCNAFGSHYRDSFVTRMRCQGTETRLLDCAHTTLDARDTSCKYASAVCVMEEKHRFGENQGWLIRRAEPQSVW